MTKKRRRFGEGNIKMVGSRISSWVKISTEFDKKFLTVNNKPAWQRRQVNKTNFILLQLSSLKFETMTSRRKFVRTT
jgi:hypothetical protein